MKLDESLIRATVLAHAIRLGKCPEPGMVISFSFRFSEIAAADLDAARMEAAIPLNEKQQYEFTVTAADIEAAKMLINTQKAQYREPKLTTVKLN